MRALTTGFHRGGALWPRCRAETTYGHSVEPEDFHPARCARRRLHLFWHRTTRHDELKWSHPTSPHAWPSTWPLEVVVGVPDADDPAWPEDRSLVRMQVASDLPCGAVVELIDVLVGRAAAVTES